MTKIFDDDSLPRTGPIGLRDAVDRWGHDLSRWPDVALAGHGREALLSDRSFRAYRDTAGALDQRLNVAVAALDQRIADSGSMERIAAAVMARAAPRAKPRSLRWLAGVAAVVLVAAVAGSASDLFAVRSSDTSGMMEVVQLDPIVFGPSELGD